MRARYLIPVLVFTLLVPIAADARILLWEQFDVGYGESNPDWIPSNWSVVNNLGEARVWEDGDFCLTFFYSSYWSDISNSYTEFAAANNFCGLQNARFGDMDTELVSNAIDLTWFENVEISFDHDFFRANPDTNGLVGYTYGYFEAYNGSIWNEIETYFDTGWNDSLENFDLSSYDGISGFQLRWVFDSISSYGGWWALDNILLEGDCAATDTGSLIEDDGTQEGYVNTDQPEAYYVSCISPGPTQFPSYLTEISAYFVDTPVVGAGAPTDRVRFVIFSDFDGNGAPEQNSGPLWEGSYFVPTTDTWNMETVAGEYDVPIHSGTWCLGVQYENYFSAYSLGTDENGVVDNNSWYGSWDIYIYWDSFSDREIDGDAMIRGEVEYCTIPTTTTTTTTTTVTTTTTTVAPTTTTTTFSPPTTTTTTVPPSDDDEEPDDEQNGFPEPEDPFDEASFRGGSFGFDCEGEN
ncbi:MAG: hypothetical protein M5R36_26525 [Deltaproteobacteria bacterium]|nr:hypothetical protein [Deltaproteobacteria bacterium]